MEGVKLPVRQINGRYWILLNSIDDKFLFRASRLSKAVQARDPSDHRSMQVEGKGSPKCTPKSQLFDIAAFQ